MKTNKRPCSFGSGNTEIVHYNVKFVCTNGGYTCFNCPEHVCPGEARCCQPVTNPLRFAKDFKAFCFHCEYKREAKWYCPVADTYICHPSVAQSGAAVISIEVRVQQLIEILFFKKGELPNERREPVKGKKEKKAKKAKKLKLKNEYGGKCPVRDTAKSGKKKKKRCGAWANYLCTAKKAYLCHEHSHNKYIESDGYCCRFVNYDEGMGTSYKPAKNNRYEGIGIFSGGFSADAEGAGEINWRREGADSSSEEKEKIENPCGVCKKESDYWCKKKAQWRCVTHMHMRWECCDRPEISDNGSSKKILKEVQFVEAS